MTPSPAPAPAAEVSVVYGVAKVPLVQELLKKQTATNRLYLEDAISALGYNPRPPGSRVSPAPGLGVVLLELPIETTSPKYMLLYFVDEAKEKVTLMAIMPTVL